MQHKYDATNEQCPLPLVKMRVILKKMRAGDTFILCISDKGSKKDVPKYLTKTGYSYSQQALDNNTVEFIIEHR